MNIGDKADKIATQCFCPTALNHARYNLHFHVRYDD